MKGITYDQPPITTTADTPAALDDFHPPDMPPSLGPASAPARRHRGRPTKAEALQWKIDHPEEVQAQAMKNATLQFLEQQGKDILDPEMMRQIDTLRLSVAESARAKFFLLAYANSSYNQAIAASGASIAQLQRWKARSKAFADIYSQLRKAHEAHAVAVTECTLEEVANGEFQPRPGKLPPDMRAASILLPAYDQRYKANAAGTGQQVQINISI